MIVYYASSVIPKKFAAIWRPEKQRASIYQNRFQLCCAAEMINEQITQRRQVERKYLLDVIQCFRYLAGEGIPLQCLDNNDNLVQILYLQHLQVQVGHKYTYGDIKNGLLHIMAFNVLRVKVSTIPWTEIFFN